MSQESHGKFHQTVIWSADMFLVAMTWSLSSGVMNLWYTLRSSGILDDVTFTHNRLARGGVYSVTRQRQHEIGAESDVDDCLAWQL